MTEERVLKFVERVKSDDKTEEEVISVLNRFVSILYSEVEDVIRQIEAFGIEHLRNVRKRELLSGLQLLSFEWKSTKIIISPILAAALPNPEFRIATFVLPKEMVGRVVIFSQYVNDSTEGLAIGEIYVSPDGKWYAAGIVGPMMEDLFDSTNLHFFALSLIESLVYKVQVHHRAIEESQFDPSRQTIRNLLGFALPQS